MLTPAVPFIVTGALLALLGIMILAKGLGLRWKMGLLCGTLALWFSGLATALKWFGYISDGLDDSGLKEPAEMVLVVFRSLVPLLAGSFTAAVLLALGAACFLFGARRETS